jgi:uncharacterized protein YqeY
MATTEHGGRDQSMQTSLLQKLKADLKKALVRKDEDAKNAIRIIMAEFPKITVPITLESGKKTTRPKRAEEITDDEIIGVIQGLIKSERMTLELKKEESSAYLRILESYLPQMASREEIQAWIRENVDFSTFKNKMQAVGAVMKHFGKTADGNLVKEIIQEWDRKSA